MNRVTHQLEKEQPDLMLVNMIVEPLLKRKQTTGHIQSLRSGWKSEK